MKNSDPHKLTKAGVIRIIVIALALLLGVFYFLRKNGVESGDLKGLFIVSAIGIIFIILIMIIMALFVRRNYYETPMGKSTAPPISKDNLLNVSNDNLQILQKYGLVIFRWFAIPSIALTFLMVYDFILPATKVEKALVLQKIKKRTGPTARGVTYIVRVEPLGSKHWYDAEANRSLFETTQNGDTLIINKSKFFGNWKDVEIIHNNQSVEILHGISDWSLSFLGLLFLAPILIFFLSNNKQAPKWIDNYQMIIWIAVPIMEILAMVLWIRFIMVWTGFIPKF